MVFESTLGFLLFLMGSILISLVIVICYKYNLFTYIAAWIRSTREEKSSLTRLNCHYHPNGYLVHSDSDIQIGHSGSFKRFDSIDKDIKFATTSFMGEWGTEIDDSIPPQPLRPAPVPTSQQVVIKDTQPIVNPVVIVQPNNGECKTSIKPLPRPVSSINMTTLQQSNAQFITPPPTPSSALPKIPQKTTQPLENTLTEDVEVIPTVLKRAISCESVCSDTSVALGDLEASNTTGYLCIALEYDSENGEMIANVLEAKDLVGPSNNKDEPLDTYVKIYLLPDKDVNVQTRIYKGSNSPSFQERVIFSLHPRDQLHTALLFNVYSTDSSSHTLIGEGELRLSDVSLRQPVTTWVTLTDTGQRGSEFGELMFSLSYLPTAERLTVVVVKGRNLKFGLDRDPGDSFVKVYALQHGKKIHKKKTSLKRAERSPIFNESMMFNIPAHSLQTIQLRLTVSEMSGGENVKTYSIGHVIIGAQATGRSLAHWNQMLSALRKPVAMWHPLRK